MVVQYVSGYGVDRFHGVLVLTRLHLSNAHEPRYSSANAIPIDGVRTGVTTCGRLMMSFGAIRFGRAWWFCGKYGLVSYELFIIAASIRVLSFGASSKRSLPRWAECAAHASCAVVRRSFLVCRQRRVYELRFMFALTLDSDVDPSAFVNDAIYEHFSYDRVDTQDRSYLRIVTCLRKTRDLALVHRVSTNEKTTTPISDALLCFGDSSHCNDMFALTCVFA